MRRMPFNAEELEKIRYIEDSYDFNSEQLQNASKDPKYAKLITLMKEAPKEWWGSVLINDLTNQSLYIGVYNNTDIQLYGIFSAETEYININYDKSTDDMEINDTIESLITEDNVKTLFGQTIIGTGDIKLYRHDLTFTEGINGEKYVGVVYSSKDLVVNTFAKLATLIGKTGNQNILVVKTTALKEATKDATNIRVYWSSEGFVWLAKNNTGTINVALGDVSDVVTPI